MSQNTQKTFKVYFKTLLVKISFICMRIKNHFYINGLELSLALKRRLGATRKLRVVMNEINILGKTMQKILTRFQFLTQEWEYFTGLLVSESVFKRQVSSSRQLFHIQKSVVTETFRFEDENDYECEI